MKWKPGQLDLSGMNVTKHSDVYDWMFVAQRDPLAAYNMMYPCGLRHVANTLSVYSTEFRSTVLFVTRMYAALSFYQKYYVVDSDLLKLARCTDPSKLGPIDAPLPLPCTVLWFINPVQMGDLTVSGVAVMDEGVEGGVNGGDEFSKRIDKGMNSFASVARIRFSTPNRLRSFMFFGAQERDGLRALGCHWWNLPFEQTYGESLRNTRSMHGAVMTDKDVDDGQAFIKAVVSYLAMTGKYEDVEWHSSSQKMRKKYMPVADKLDLVELSPTWLGKKSIRTLLDEDAEPTGMHQRPHWRSAHWKSQHYGPKNSLRKIIRIQAYMVGKENICEQRI